MLVYTDIDIYRMDMWTSLLAALLATYYYEATNYAGQGNESLLWLYAKCV
jgi:hypothetical protein